MQLFYFLLMVITVAAACNGAETSSAMDSTAALEAAPTITPKDTATTPVVQGNQQKLALTTEAIQLVDSQTGSTKEIAFGISFDQLVPIVTRVLNSEPANVGVNAECGAGPLKMASWSNGLTLVFQQKQRDIGDWLFAGWFAGKPIANTEKPITMAGIGVGSTLADLESTYVTTVTTSTLGQEFAVKNGFFGLLSGPGKDAMITDMWSGVSCNFR